MEAHTVIYQQAKYSEYLKYEPYHTEDPDNLLCRASIILEY